MHEIQQGLRAPFKYHVCIQKHADVLAYNTLNYEVPLTDQMRKPATSLNPAVSFLTASVSEVSLTSWPTTDSVHFFNKTHILI